MLNLISRDYFDDIIDGVSSYFNEDEYDDKIDDENSENNIEWYYVNLGWNPKVS